jgi:hypothetical protein
MTDTRPSRFEGGPGRLQVISERRHRPRSGYHDACFHRVQYKVFTLFCQSDATGRDGDDATVSDMIVSDAVERQLERSVYAVTDYTAGMKGPTGKDPAAFNVSLRERFLVHTGHASRVPSEVL